MLKHGAPQGYFGYNESQALVGTFANWVPLTFGHMYFAGLIFGWSESMPIFVNLALWTVGFAAFAKVFKPSIMQMAFVSVTWMAYETVIRYIFSVTPETFITVLLLLVAVLSVQYNQDGKLCWLILADILFAILIIIRPYYAAFCLVLIYISYKNSKKLTGAAIQIGVTVAAALAAIVMMHYLTSPYFTGDAIPEVDFSISSLKGMIRWGLFYTAKYIISALKLETMRGSWYWLFFIVAGFTFFAAMCRKNNRIFLVFLAEMAILASMYILYNADEGGRQLMAIASVGLIFVAFGLAKYRWGFVLPIVVFALTWLCQDSFYCGMPLKDVNQVAMLEENSAVLEKLMPITDEPWDNTICYSLNCKHNDMYAIPDGFGFNCGYESYIIENINEIKSKYVITSKGEDADLFMQKKGYKLLHEYGTVNIYQIR